MSIASSDSVRSAELSNGDGSPDIAASYDGSTSTYRLLRSFYWGPTLMNLGYFPYRGLLRPLNLLSDLSLAQRRLAGKSIRLLDVRNGQAVLDVACGRGETSFIIAQSNPLSRVVGLDYLAENTAAAKTLFTGVPRLEYQRGDAMQLEFPDASFDRVHCLEAAFHFPDKQRFLNECARVLKPGGRLVIVDIVWRNAAARRQSDPVRAAALKKVWQFDDLFAQEEYINGAAAAGFDEVRSEDWTRGVTDPIVSLLQAALWIRRRSWGRKLLEWYNPPIAVLTDDDWRELEQTADAYRMQQRLATYTAFTARRGN